MPATLTYPGVYIEEISSGVHTITGVATSITAFIGRALRGPINEPITINGFADFERRFGGLWAESTLGYAVRDFFINGGSQAMIVRLFKPDEIEVREKSAGAQAVLKAGQAGTSAADLITKATKAQTDIDAVPSISTAQKDAAKAVLAAAVAANTAGKSKDDILKDMAAVVATETLGMPAAFTLHSLTLEAASPGSWASSLRVAISALPPKAPATAVSAFDLTVTDARPGGRTEKFLDLTTDPNSVRRIDQVLAEQSELLNWSGSPPTGPTDFTDVSTARRAVDDARKIFDEANTPADVRAAWKNGADGLIVKLNAFWALALDPVSTAERKLVETTAFLKRLQVADPNLDVTTELQLVATATRNLADLQAALAVSLSDGSALDYRSFFPAGGADAKRGIYALEKADLFNLLCIPPHSQQGDIEVQLISDAIAYCEGRRAMMLVDPPSGWVGKDQAKGGIAAGAGDPSKNAAIFFPRLMQPDPLRDGNVRVFAPCGAVAGIFARTDTERGVWKAPAGLDATVKGVPQLSVPLTDAENGELNPLGINCLRAFAASGRVVWGSRTRVGDDRLASEWKYIPVRRTALFIEESLYRGTQWVVFEPNDEPLWSQIRLNVGAFMQNLFRQGAFQGRTPREAYLVKCDSETTTQNDINLGIVNIIVGFAPLKPAEFVIIKLQQLAGQIEV
jgi:uncharacterized protein